MKRKVVMVLTLGGALVLVLFAVIRIAQYLHIQSFETAVSDLVESGTGGRYILEIGETDADYLNFSLRIKDLVVRKKDSNDIQGIVEVRVPDILIDLGSITRVLTSSQFQIEKLSITEPVATIGLKNKSTSDNTPVSEPLNFPRQIARFYPVVKTILEHFDIGLFQIERAALNLEKSQQTFQVSLLDLLVSDWNMQHLADEASFHLSLGNQSVTLQNATFSFGSIVWDYHQNELDILDYRYIQKDSMGRKVIEVDGSSLKVAKFDYEKLIAEEYYYLDRLLVIDPKISAFIHPGSPKPDKSKHPLADILKSHFGTMMIRDAEILNAQIDATIYQEQDTLFIHLPGMNLITGNFHVDEDSSTIMIDQLNLDIHQTELDINHQITLSFENLVYDQDYNLKVDSIRVFNKPLSQTLLFSQEMNLYNFSVFHYFFENHLKMDSAFISDAQLHLTEYSLQKPTTGGHSNKPPPSFNVGLLKVQNVNADLQLDSLTASIAMRSATINNILFDGELDYTIQQLEVPTLNLSAKEGLSLSMSDLYIEPRQLTINDLVGSYQELKIAGNKLKLIPGQAISPQTWSKDLRQLEVAQLSINGMVPTKQKKPKSHHGFQTNVAQVLIGSLQADLELNDSAGVSTSQNNLRVKGISLTNDNAWSVQGFQTTVKSGAYQNGPFTYQLDGAQINTNTISHIDGIEIANQDKMLLQTAVELGPVHQASDSLVANYVLLRHIKYLNLMQNTTSTIDSIRFNNIFITNDLPFLDQVLVYGPDLSFAPQPSVDKPNVSSKRLPVPSELFGELIISPGQISFNQQLIKFDTVELEVEEGLMQFDINKLAFATPNNSIGVGRIRSGATDLFFDEVKIEPNPEYDRQIDYETDIMSLKMDEARLHQVAWDAFWKQGILDSDSMTFDGIDVSIKRDKTLPDPEHVWKAYLLADFIPDLDNVCIPQINGKNGKVIYTEVGEKTGQEGQIAVEDISFQFNRYQSLSEAEEVSFGKGMIYGEGPIEYQYHRLDSGKFSLRVKLSDMSLMSLNQMVDPLEAARFKSGYLQEFEFNMIGDSLKSKGTGTISYDDLHVEIFKSHQPDVKNFGSELLTLLVDKLILKHSKHQASADFVQDRITFKGPINYWVKSGIHAASATVIKGKSPKKSKKKSKRKNR